VEYVAPKIEWERRGKSPCLRFTFGAHLGEHGAREAIAEWRRLFETAPPGKVALIWDCREMKGYDSAARTIWQETLKELRDQIGTIFLISDSAMIRMGASVMSLFSSLEIKPVRSEAEIELG